MLQATIDALQATVDASDAANESTQPAATADGIAGLWFSEPRGETQLQSYIFLDGRGEFFTWNVELGEIETPFGGTYLPSTDDALMLQTPQIEAALNVRLRVDPANPDRGQWSGDLGDYGLSRIRLDKETTAKLEGLWLAGGEAEVELGKAGMGGIFGISGDYTFGALGDGTVGIFATDGSEAFFLCQVEAVDSGAPTLVCEDTQIPLQRAQ